MLSIHYGFAVRTTIALIGNHKAALAAFAFRQDEKPDH
jgi:hypothetical protein